VNIAWESCGSIVRICGGYRLIHGASLVFPQLRADIHATPVAKSQASPRSVNISTNPQRSSQQQAL
jgi:hypothetical protein